MWLNQTYARLLEDIHPLHYGWVLQVQAFCNLFHFRRKRDLLENLVPSRSYCVKICLGLLGNTCNGGRVPSYSGFDVSPAEVDLPEHFILTFLSDTTINISIHLQNGCLQSQEKLFVIFIGPRYPWSHLWVTHSLQDLFEDLTDVTLVDEDTNSIPTNNTNRTIQDNMWQCKWQNQVNKFKTSAVWCANLNPHMTNLSISDPGFYVGQDG